MQALNPGASAEMDEELYSQESALKLKLNAPEYVALGNDFEIFVNVKMDEKMSSDADITVTNLYQQIREN